MTIENRNLTPGMTLIGRYHKQEHTCQVIQGENNKLRYRLEDGREFKSPSAAGMAISGHACDGWHFWSVATAAPAENLPAPEATNPEPATVPTATTTEMAVAPAPDAGTTTEQKEPPKKSFMRTPNQKNTPQGQVKWYCHECGESFLAPYGEIPDACPQGHKA